MRALVLLLFSCAALHGANTGLQLTTTHWTNAANTKIVTTEVFTRGGRTNLVRKTFLRDGKFALREQTFFHDGTLIGEYSVLGTNSLSVTIQPASPYFLDLEYKRSKDLQVVVVFTKDHGVVLDGFSCTNGVFTPVPDSLIKSANNWPEDLERLIHTNQIDHVSQSDDQTKPDKQIENEHDQ